MELGFLCLCLGFLVLNVECWVLGFGPSSIYSWSIDHILEHEFFCLGRLGCPGSKEKKVDLSFSEELLRVFFSTFCGQKKS